MDDPSQDSGRVEPTSDPETTEAPRPHMTLKEFGILAFFVALTGFLIWLAASDVWNKWFKVDETPGVMTVPRDLLGD